MPPLRIVDLHVAYGSTQALDGLSLEVPAGAAVAVAGPNGAGKTTLLRAVSGLLALHGGRVRGGRVDVGVVAAGPGVPGLRGPNAVPGLRGPNAVPGLRGPNAVPGLRGPNAVPGLRGPNAVPGLRGPNAVTGYVLEGRRVFPDLTVDENLRVGAFTVRDRAEARARVAWVLDRFPLLASRRATRAGHLSGGEQQLLAIGRAVVPFPSLLLLDEPTVGLAEDAVAQVAGVVAEMMAAGTAVLLAEQEVRLAPALGAEVLRLVRGRAPASVPAPA